MSLRNAFSLGLYAFSIIGIVVLTYLRSHHMI
jgi:hypothetical protein